MLRYRGRIIYVDDEPDYSNDLACIEKVRVFFVDYGQADTVDVLSIKEMKPVFLQLPFQAVEGSLVRIKPAASSRKLSKAANKKFFDLTRNVQMRAKVLYNDGVHLGLDIWREGQDGQWTNIADELINAGEAIEVDHIPVPKSGEWVVPG